VTSTSLRRQQQVRIALLIWSIIGGLILLWASLRVLDLIRLAVVPLVLALFPAALLSPLSDRLQRRMPPAAAAGLVLIGFIVALFGTLWLIGWLLVDEAPAVVDAVEDAYEDVVTFAEDRFDVTIPALDEALDRAQEWATGAELGDAGRTVATTTLELLSGFLLLLVALFFYLKDKGKIFRFLVELSPPPAREHVAEVGHRVWATLGGYFQGQLVVAAVDAFFIGLGLVLLGVPLALPLAVLVFFGGLFPIVGAFTAGALAVLVALADAGLGTALAVLVLNVVVQQVEGNLLEPLIVGRVTRLHPLVILAALTAGGVTLGILGAFLAVPVTACVVRAVGYVIEMRRGETPRGEPDDDPGPSTGVVAV
jgi:predicted PurR-regulated permease PerM